MQYPSSYNIPGLKPKTGKLKKIGIALVALLIVALIIAVAVLATGGTKNVNKIKNKLKMLVGGGWTFWDYEVSEAYLSSIDPGPANTPPKDLMDAKAKCNANPNCIAVHETKDDDPKYTLYNGKVKYQGDDENNDNKYIVKLKPIVDENGILHVMGERVTDNGSVLCDDSVFSNVDFKCIQVPPQFPPPF